MKEGDEQLEEDFRTINEHAKLKGFDPKPSNPEEAEEDPDNAG